MMRNNFFDTPVLFVIFRRKDTALKVIEAIAAVKPRKLYISQDGPRNKKEETEVLETRKAVLAKINWPCQLVVWTHKENLGLKKHIPKAFNDFFKKEEMGIYLEDDTLPSKEFFYFEQELLNKYKNDKKIFSINGTNFYPEKVDSKDSYYLSKIGDIWGFGLWRRSWKLYNSDMNNFETISKTAEYKNYFFNKKYKFYLEIFWKAIIRGKLDSWAMQLVYAAVKNNMFFIAPNVNMVNNIGVTNIASNPSLQYYNEKFGNPFPLRHPEDIVYDKTKDIIYFKNMLKGGWVRIALSNLYFRFSPKSRKTIGAVTTRIIKNFDKND